MHTTTEREKKSEESDVRKMFLFLPYHFKILVLFVRLISERSVRRR
jgi:hypothetical protein